MHDEMRQPSIRYALGADRRDVDLFLSAFADGAVLRVFDPATAETPVSTRDTPARLADIIERLGAYDATFHLLGQSAFDGDTGEVYCVAHHKRRDGTDVVMYIRYRDRYTRTHGDAGEWRIAERDVLVDWTETRRVTDPPPGE